MFLFIFAYLLSGIVGEVVMQCLSTPTHRAGVGGGEELCRGGVQEAASGCRERGSGGEAVGREGETKGEWSERDSAVEKEEWRKGTLRV